MPDRLWIARGLALAAAAALLPAGVLAAEDADVLPFAPAPGQGVFLILSDIHLDPFADPAIVEDLVAATFMPGAASSSARARPGLPSTAATPTTP